MATAVSAAPDAPLMTMSTYRAPQQNGRPGAATGTFEAATGAFDTFVTQVFGPLPRADQRKWARAYTQGLLITPGRKTVRALAAAVSESGTASQALHQFVNASPWDWEPVRAGLARWVARRARPHALLITAAVLPKRGDRSCGVHRRFDPQAGRTVNCQVGIGAFLATSEATVPVDWRLLLPGEWTADPRVRSRARIPGTTPSAQESPCEQALSLVDDLDRALADSPDGPHGPDAPDAPPVVADLTGIADPVRLIGGLTARQRQFVVAVPGDLPVLPDPAVSVGSVPHPRTAIAVSARHLIARRHARQPHTPVITGTVRLPGVPGAFRLLAQWPSAEPGSGRIWLTDLVDSPPREALALARLHPTAADTLKLLEDDLGLRAFEGRSYPGWHHHMTLVSAAFAYGSLGPAALFGSAQPSRAVRVPRAVRAPGQPARPPLRGARSVPHPVPRPAPRSVRNVLTSTRTGRS